MSNFELSKLHLPLKVKSVQSPLSWLEDPEILKDVPAHLLSSSDSEFKLQSYIEFLLHNGSKDVRGDDDMGAGDFTPENGNNEGHSDGDGDGDEGVYVTFKKIGHRLNISALWAYTEKYEEAESWLEKGKILKDKLYQIGNVKHGQRLALEYCIEALEWSIKELQEKTEVKVEVDNKENLEDEDSEEEEVPEVEEFRGRWEDLMAYEREAEAVVAYFKARLSEVLTVPLDKILEKMEAVVDIDPDYFEWYQSVYQLLRRIRRSVKRNLNNEQLQRPCEKESLACRTAYELAPENFQCISNVALLIKEGLWTMEVAEWELEEDDVLLCVKLFREALKMAEEKNLKRYICKTKVYLGEVMLFGRGSKLQPLQEEGKSLLDECEALYPQSSLVLHKLAKLFHYGANGSRKFRNTQMARVYYKRSLEVCPHNFACLMDFLKLVKGEASRAKGLAVCQKLYQEILEEFKKCREVIRVDHQVARMCILEGCIVWIFNPWREAEDDRKTNACRVWLEVFKKWPEFADSLFRTIEKPPFYLGWNRPAYVPIPLLTTTLKKIKVEEEKVKPEEKLGGFISTFIEGLGKIPRTNSHSRES